MTQYLGSVGGWALTRIECTEMVHELRYVDGLPCPEVASRVGVSRETVATIAPGRPGKIDNTRLREAFLRSGKAASAVARDLSWWAGRSPDGGRVGKTLGIALTAGGPGRKGQHRRMIDAETAARIAESIGVEPWEVGCNDA